MKRNAVIFGAGNWGQLAYYYYKDKCSLLCYIDNDQAIWGEKINGLEVCSPEFLTDKKDVTVIVANSIHVDDIKKQLYSEFGVSTVILFSVKEQLQEIGPPNTSYNKIKELIISFEGGLGNQMFQYAFYRFMKQKAKRVTADRTFYIKFGTMPFELQNVFKNIRLERCTPGLKEYFEEAKTEYNRGKMCYEDFDISRLKMNEILKIDCGVIKGYHQTTRFADCIKQELIKDFQFSNGSDCKLQKIANEFLKMNLVGIHVRRGDYLDRGCKEIYGGICTEHYYKRAIEYIYSKIPHIKLCFFSNDIQWVKRSFKIENAIYIIPEMFDSYQNWYDMYLMSLCKHNIIANSTFSWWGAWLNTNKNKIVIAPEKWMNIQPVYKIIPPEWIKV